MVAWSKVDGAWQEINFVNGLAQGRPLSPALAAILLQPILIATKKAMAVECGLEFGSAALDLKIGCGAYIDDATLVGHVDVVAKGFKVFTAECAKRGWRVNVAKTVLGVDLAKSVPRPAPELARRAAHITTVFPANMAVTNEGLVFLGTPVGTERGEWVSHAPVPLGGQDYRRTKVLEFIDDHDKRLRNVIKLARRDTRSHDHTAHVSVQLAQMLLRWSCNARDVTFCVASAAASWTLQRSGTTSPSRWRALQSKASSLCRPRATSTTSRTQVCLKTTTLHIGR
jgi:hypothetical protein